MGLSHGASRMATFIVRVGYDWAVACYRQVEIDALDEADAATKAVDQSRSEPDFWAASTECDGEAIQTIVLDVTTASSS